MAQYSKHKPQSEKRKELEKEVPDLIRQIREARYTQGVTSMFKLLEITRDKFVMQMPNTYDAGHMAREVAGRQAVIQTIDEILCEIDNYKIEDGEDFDD